MTAIFLFCLRLGVAAGLNVLTIVNITLFPSDFRATAFGITNIFARIAAIVSPIVAELAQPLPYIILVAINLIHTFVGFFIIERTDGE